MNASLYQMKATPDNHMKIFAGLDFVDEKINLNDYNKVAEINLDEFQSDNINMTLEAIFTYGNSNEEYYQNNPQARSISVSDIIEIDGKFYYVDSFGFEEVSDKITRDIVEEDINDVPELEDFIQDLVNNYNDIDTSDLQGIVMARCMITDEDEDEILDEIYKRVAEIYTESKKVSLIESICVDEECKTNLLNQLIELGMTEEQASSTLEGIVNIFNKKSNAITESLEAYQDKLSIAYMAKIFTKMRENGWDGNPDTADKYFDDIMRQIDPNFKEAEPEKEEEPLREGLLLEDENHTISEEAEEEEDSSIVDLLQDRIGQEISIGEFNTIMQSIFGKFNQVFLQTSEIYNMDPGEPQELTIWEDDDAFVITFNIVDEVAPTIEITDVEIQ